MTPSSKNLKPGCLESAPTKTALPTGNQSVPAEGFVETGSYVPEE